MIYPWRTQSSWCFKDLIACQGRPLCPLIIGVTHPCITTGQLNHLARECLLSTVVLYSDLRGSRAKREWFDPFNSKRERGEKQHMQIRSRKRTGHESASERPPHKIVCSLENHYESLWPNHETRSLFKPALTCVRVDSITVLWVHSGRNDIRSLRPQSEVVWARRGCCPWQEHFQKLLLICRDCTQHVGCVRLPEHTMKSTRSAFHFFSLSFYLLAD